MITSARFKENVDYQPNLLPETHQGLTSVFAAAVVNQSFRERLLRDPKTALDQGYLGKGFSLSQEETSLILSINASSLADLARQIISEK